MHNGSSSSSVESTKTSRQKFSANEDKLLRSLVAELGTKSWKKVSARMGTRTTRQCRERYNNYLAPTIKNEPWTQEEDTLLEEKVREVGQKWSLISHFFNARSDVNIKNRYALLVSKGLALPGVSFHPALKKHKAEMQSTILAQKQKQLASEESNIKPKNIPQQSTTNQNQKPVDKDVFSEVIDSIIKTQCEDFLNEGGWVPLNYDFDGEEAFYDTIY